MVKAGVTAQWDMALNCECPKCKEDVDLLTIDDFWDYHSGLQPIENGTERSNNLEVECPECGHEFNVCCEY